MRKKSKIQVWLFNYTTCESNFELEKHFFRAFRKKKGDLYWKPHCKLKMYILSDFYAIVVVLQCKAFLSCHIDFWRFILYFLTRRYRNRTTIWYRVYSVYALCFFYTRMQAVSVANNDKHHQFEMLFGHCKRRLYNCVGISRKWLRFLLLILLLNI